MSSRLSFPFSVLTFNIYPFPGFVGCQHIRHHRSRRNQIGHGDPASNHQPTRTRLSQTSLPRRPKRRCRSQRSSRFALTVDAETRFKRRQATRWTHLFSFKSRTRDSTPCCVGPSVGNISEFRAVLALLLLPNRPRLDCRVSGLVYSVVGHCMVC